MSMDPEPPSYMAGVSLREYFEMQFKHLETRHKSLDDKADQILAMQRSIGSRLNRAERRIALLSGAYGLGVAIISWVVIKLFEGR